MLFFGFYGWAVDVLTMLMSARWQKMAAMIHNQHNQLVNYMWNRVRQRLGGRMHARNDGIKLFISSAQPRYWGYHLPDQDYVDEYSKFVDFLPLTKQRCRLSAA